MSDAKEKKEQPSAEVKSEVKRTLDDIVQELAATNNEQKTKTLLSEAHVNIALSRITTDTERRHFFDITKSWLVRKARIYALNAELLYFAEHAINALSSVANKTAADKEKLLLLFLELQSYSKKVSVDWLRQSVAMLNKYYLPIADNTKQNIDFLTSIAESLIKSPEANEADRNLYIAIMLKLDDFGSRDALPNIIQTLEAGTTKTAADYRNLAQYHYLLAEQQRVAYIRGDELQLAVTQLQQIAASERTADDDAKLKLYTEALQAARAEEHRLEMKEATENSASASASSSQGLSASATVLVIPNPAKKKNLYELLGVNQYYSCEEIIKAYIQNRDPKHIDRKQYAALLVLQDETKRAAYDRELDKAEKMEKKEKTAAHVQTKRHIEENGAEDQNSSMGRFGGDDGEKKEGIRRRRFH